MLRLGSHHDRANRPIRVRSTADLDPAGLKHFLYGVPDYLELDRDAYGPGAEAGWQKMANHVNADGTIANIHIVGKEPGVSLRNRIHPAAVVLGPLNELSARVREFSDFSQSSTHADLLYLDPAKSKSQICQHKPAGQRSTERYFLTTA